MVLRQVCAKWLSCRLALLSLVLLAACADAELEALAGLTGGSVVIEGSTAPISAVVTPLVGGVENERGAPTVYGVDPNTMPRATDEAGRFTLDLDPVPSSAPSQRVAVQVTMWFPSERLGASGRLDWRAELEVGSSSNTIEIDAPSLCRLSIELCGQPLLPDLTPIVAWSQLPAEAEERLRPSSDSPVSAGLLPSTTWFVDEVDGRTLLRFATVAANVGAGPLDIIAEPNESGDSAVTMQRVWTDEWNYTEVQSGEFLAHETHEHIHFDSFERYRLLDAGGAVVASSDKVSFCLRDSVLLTEDTRPLFGPMLASDNDCGARQQVINAGFGDHYHALLDDQWIDISGVSAGTYRLEITVDPLGLIVESDESNNTASITITL